jgi:hypothetical protein
VGSRMILRVSPPFYWNLRQVMNSTIENGP